MSAQHNLFRLNIGFIIHQTVGFSRDFIIDTPIVHLPPDLDLQELVGDVRVTRTPPGLLFQVKMAATIVAECVRCLETFNQPLSVDFTELFTFSKESITEPEFIVPEEGIIDLAPLIREEFFLSVPLSPLCNQDCKGFCAICGGNMNMVPCEHNQVQVDPRLDILKSLLEDDLT
ncbi:DUF177 domain-containing protein [Chloroflexota bacterium]